MLFKRIVSFVIGAPVLLATLFYPEPVLFKVLVGLSSLFALNEFYTMTFAVRSKRFFGLVLGAFYGLTVLFSARGELFFMVPVALVIVSSFAYTLLEAQSPSEPLAESTHQVALYLLGTFYVTGFTLYIGLLRELPMGIFWVLALLVGTWMNDSCAFFVGKGIGRHKLSPRVSPGKTVEGFIGGLLGTAAGLFILRGLFHEPISFQQTILLALIIGFLGPAGDLAESLIKRSYQVKDSGSLIPGHGGVLDRIDALIFNAPFVYTLALILK
ncbi:MAG: phosphatidate cytidylyltransferase [Deltaproteobacteria bacterium]|nr:phosphatidate cytidylyltransferase [Deltaproteobacteria bacterium]